MLSIPQCTGRPTTGTDLVPRVNSVNRDGIHFPSELGPELRGSYAFTFILCFLYHHSMFEADPEATFQSLAQDPEG